MNITHSHQSSFNEHVTQNIQQQTSKLLTITYYLRTEGTVSFTNIGKKRKTTNTRTQTNAHCTIL